MPTETEPLVAFKAPPTLLPPPAPETPDATPASAPDLPTLKNDPWLRAQIALTRRFFACGPIDGVHGAQTSAALYAFQESNGLPKTGALDAETSTLLFENSPQDLFTEILLQTGDFAGLQPLSPTWLGKSEQTALDHETILERIAERTHASPTLLRRLNPFTDWDNLLPGARILAPAIERPPAPAKAARLHIRLTERVLQVRDANNLLVAHFPVSIARDVEKRPEGELRVTVAIENPDYTFDPELFKESDEARSIGRKLVLPPGPNNPVGIAWIGLDRQGYGIHGTPKPEQVGRTESHGCFRLANWDARALLAMTRKDLPVLVEP